ncbi:hypothetical protein HMPREF9621_02601 [Cutibacterium modestum HL037PA2]|nr:hypothetical protein HMPREF9621_02601 [Cutibacterium modestum HL037PA2]
MAVNGPLISSKCRSLRGAEAKDAAESVAAIVGLDFLKPCKAVMGL